jgi:hypothetical protein
VFKNAILLSSHGGTGTLEFFFTPRRQFTSGGYTHRLLPSERVTVILSYKSVLRYYVAFCERSEQSSAGLLLQNPFMNKLFMSQGAMI